MNDGILWVLGDDAANEAVLARLPQVARRGAEVGVLDVVHVPALDGYLGNTAIYEQLRTRVLAERRERAATLAQKLRDEGFAAHATAVWGHPREDAVARHAAAVSAALVVFVPHIGGGLSHGDWRLVQTCPTPTLIVNGPGSKPYRRVVAAVDPFHANAKPADLDAAILAVAKVLAERNRASLTAVHCYVPVSYFGAELGPPLASDDNFSDARREALDELLRAAQVDPAAAKVVAGEPHAVLQRMSETGEADVIVMGVLVRGRIKELLIGSTAERVLHHTRADVLVVKS